MQRVIPILIIPILILGGAVFLLTLMVHSRSQAPDDCKKGMLRQEAPDGYEWVRMVDTCVPGVITINNCYYLKEIEKEKP